MATPFTGSHSKLDILYAANGVGRGLGRGRGTGKGQGTGRGRGGVKESGQRIVQGRGRGIFRKVNLPPIKNPQTDSTKTVSTKTVSTKTDSTTTPTALQLKGREVTKTEQFSDAGSGHTEEKKQPLEPMPETAAQEYSSYTVVVQEFEKAVANDQHELALQLAAYLSFSLPGATQALTRTERSKLKIGYRALEQSLPWKQLQEQAQPPEHRQLLMALIARTVNADCTTATHIKHSKDTIASLGTTHKRKINQHISALEHHIALGDTLHAAKHFKIIAQTYPILLNDEQYKQIIPLVQVLIPKLYEEAKKYTDPQQALHFLRTHLFPYIDFVHPEKPKPGAGLEASNNQDQLYQWLSEYFDQNNGMEAGDIYYWKALIRFLGNHHHILRRHSTTLHNVLVERTPKTTDPRAESVIISLKQQLMQGNSQEVLLTCQAISSTTPAIWCGHKAAILNYIFICALKEELTSQCHKAVQAQELTLQHCKRLNTLFFLLRNMHYAPTDKLLLEQHWLTGSVNRNILFTLRYLFSTRVLQPLWESAARGSNDQTSIDQLQQLIDDYGELLSPSHFQQLNSLKAPLPNEEIPQASAVQPDAHPPILRNAPNPSVGESPCRII